VLPSRQFLSIGLQTVPWLLRGESAPVRGEQPRQGERQGSGTAAKVHNVDRAAAVPTSSASTGACPGGRPRPHAAEEAVEQVGERLDLTKGARPRGE
jgi:hypothetical protein